MNFYKIFRPIIFSLDAEIAHNLAIDFLRFCPRAATLLSLKKDYKNLKNNLFGLDFFSPVGMAAGFDKNAQVALTLEKFGFGFIEVGTVTPRPQIGNEKPRLFRLKEDEAVINRFGFNGSGADIFAKNIEEILPRISIPLGINIGKNKDTQNALDDYLPLLERFYNFASYITINISSPNTKNLRDLQNEEQLNLFLKEIVKKKNELKKSSNKDCAILLKLAPDLEIAEQEKISQVVLNNQIDGLIVSNTTIARDFNLRSYSASEVGGLSGKPLFTKSNEVLKNFYKLTEGKIPLVGVGGISSGADAYEKIKCGASLIQLYSAFIYEGFGLVEKIKKDLSWLLEKDGFDNISQAIGASCNF